jgi:hypothetical protein
MVRQIVHPAVIMKVRKSSKGNTRFAMFQAQAQCMVRGSIQRVPFAIMPKKAIKVGCSDDHFVTVRAFICADINASLTTLF